MTLELAPLTGLPEFSAGDDLGRILADKLAEISPDPEREDVLCVAHKIVSKAEGRYVSLDSVDPGPLARAFARQTEKKTAREIQVVLDHSRRIVKMQAGIIIAETPHGYVCANAGVDRSNVRGANRVLLLPEDPDQSARQIRRALERTVESPPAVIVTDTWGRPWREGQVNFAIGVTGIDPIKDYRGTPDVHGRTLTETRIAVADECAAAAELIMGKTNRVPAVLIRGYPGGGGSGAGKDLVRAPEDDFFR